MQTHLHSAQGRQALLTSLEGREALFSVSAQAPARVLPLPVPSISRQCPPVTNNMAFCLPDNSWQLLCSILSTGAAVDKLSVLRFSVPHGVPHVPPYPGTFLVLWWFCSMFFQLVLLTFIGPGVVCCGLASRGGSHSLVGTEKLSVHHCFCLLLPS